MSIDVGDFLDAVTGYSENATDALTKGSMRLAIIDPAYTSGRPKVTFEGETALSTKTYAPIDYTPRPSDRVVMLPIGSTYVILGKLDGRPTIAPVLSSARPSSPFLGQTIFETDTGYLRIWNGTIWQYQSGPEISAKCFHNGGYNTVAGNQLASFTTRLVVGDITTTATRITFNRPGWYDLFYNTRVNSSPDLIERFLSFDIYDASNAMVAQMSQNVRMSGESSIHVGGPFLMEAAGWYVQMKIYTEVATTVMSGWGIRANALFLRPVA